MGKWKDENELSVESHLDRPLTILLNAVRQVRGDQRCRAECMLHYIEEALDLLGGLTEVDNPSFPGWEEDRL
jgi:hypothetical protein